MLILVRHIGVRVLISLTSDLLVEQGTNYESGFKSWNIVDKFAPEVTISASNIDKTSFTLTANGKDNESDIAKYEFYIDNTLVDTVTTAANEVIYNAKGKTAETTYKAKVRVYDVAGNYKDSDEIEVTTKIEGVPIVSVVQIGDFVNYDAGNWDASVDNDKITASGATVSWIGTASANARWSPPDKVFYVADGVSRNSNCPIDDDDNNTKYSGWRVWSKDETTETVTLISAGTPEWYAHVCGPEDIDDIRGWSLLQGRDCSMYVNEYADEAHFLTFKEYEDWRDFQIDNGDYGSDIRLPDDIVFGEEFPLRDLISVGSPWFFAGAVYDENYDHLAVVDYMEYEGLWTIAYDASGGDSGVCGLRVLVTLKSDVRVKTEAGDGTELKPYEIVENSTSTTPEVQPSIGIEYNPSVATSENVKVTFTNNTEDSTLTLKYQIGTTTGEWAEYTEPIEMTENGIVYAKLFDNNGEDVVTAVANVVNIDELAPNKPTIEASNVESTTVTLTASATDQAQTTDYACSGIASYVFSIYDKNGTEVATNTIDSTASSKVWNVTSGVDSGTSYTAKVVVFDAAGNSNTSDEIEFTTAFALGDYVDYSVTVNGTTYDKWRILHFDTNGHMEIVCYNGPSYTLGTDSGDYTTDSLKYADSKSDYVNCIQILNNESQAYINSAKYGVSARHLGSNPTSPNDYATINSSYVVFNEAYYDQGSSHAYYPYLEQTHYQKANRTDPDKDVDALKKFAVSPYLNSDSWLAAREFVAGIRRL